MNSSILLLLSLAFSASLAFDVTKKSPNAPSKIKQGQSVTLSVKVDDYYEWCTFKSPDGKICDFQWKKPEWNVTVLNCNDFAGRFKYVGDYDNYVCAVRITDVQGDEAGEWSVELENYYNGQTRNYGYKTNAKYVVEVEVPTTTTTTTTTTKSTTNIPDYYQEYENEYENGDDESAVGNEVGEKSEQGAAGNNKRRPQNDSNMTFIILAILVVIFVLVLIVVVALYFKRKLPDACYGKRWKPVDGNETLEDGAAGAKDEDEEKHPSIVKNGGEGAKVDPAKDTATWTADEKEPLKDGGDKEEETAAVKT